MIEKSKKVSNRTILETREQELLFNTKIDENLYFLLGDVTYIIHMYVQCTYLAPNGLTELIHSLL